MAATNDSNHGTARASSSQHDEVVTLSAPRGEGDGTHRILRVRDWTFTVPGAEGIEPEIPDSALAPRLGLDLDKLRELSARHEKAGNISPRVFFPTVGENRRGRGRPARQRFYTEADALFLVTRSEAPGAIALTKEMIDIYVLARRGLLAPACNGPDPTVMLRAAVAEIREGLRDELSAELKKGFAAVNANVAKNTNGPVLNNKGARSQVLGPMMTIARLVAGADAPQRKVMSERGKVDRNVRKLLEWDAKWKYFPTDRAGELLVTLDVLRDGARRLADRAAPAVQVVIPFPQKKS